MSFLTAEWRKLAIANYSIDPEVLQKYVPYKTELDLWNGKCYVSLIGFLFQNTKLLGVKIPFHSDFEEVNLRFYVKYQEAGEWKRGVVFIKEIVPKAAITFIANTFYGEHYQTLPMHHIWKNDKDSIEVSYHWKLNNTNQHITVTAKNTLTQIPIDSEIEFITEHYWGYSKVSADKTSEYGVRHPRWQAYEVLDYKINVDFGFVYGNHFSFLNQQKPDSVMLAEGSLISVENKKSIK